LGDGWETEGDRKWLGGGVSAEIVVVIGELLNEIFNEAVDIPLEHGARGVEAELFDDVFVNPAGQRVDAEGIDAKKFEVMLLQVMEAVVGKFIDGRGGRHCM
jgi:hypothetical protein